MRFVWDLSFVILDFKVCCLGQEDNLRQSEICELHMGAPLDTLDLHMHLKIPSRHGTYALVLSSTIDRPVVIGKLGTLKVKSGFYVYVGSAFGPGGLLARIRHHRNNTGCPHWHMDYLGKYLRLDEIVFTCDAAHREHQWARILSKARGSMVPLAGFGSSDCRCKSHLYYFISRPSSVNFRRKIYSSLDNHDRIYII